MNEVQRAKLVFKILNKTYPEIKVPLVSRNVFTLLISVLLSAQCTDVNVNNVTRNIYPKSIQSTELNSNTASIEIKDGDLIIFPAYLPHSVEENKSDEDRVIVSFNLDILR